MSDYVTIRRDLLERAVEALDLSLPLHANIERAKADLRDALAQPAAEALERTPMEPTKPGSILSPEPKFRMDAYYYGFAPTGLLVVDLILSAVACAGKCFHSTEQWTEECTPYHDRLRGTSPAEWIQHAADDCAAAIRAIAPLLPAPPEGWVACSKRMPGEGETVLVASQAATSVIAAYVGTDGQWRNLLTATAVIYPVSHWMPLPHAPKD